MLILKGTISRSENLENKVDLNILTKKPTNYKLYSETKIDSIDSW